MSVNMKYKDEMISRLGGHTKAPEEDQVSNQEKLGPDSDWWKEVVESKPVTPAPDEKIRKRDRI